MLRAVLSLASALFSSLPELVRMAREWQAEQSAAKEKAARDKRNAEAIAAAQKPKEPTP